MKNGELLDGPRASRNQGATNMAAGECINPGLASKPQLRREGAAVTLEAIKPAHWPEHFFEAIRIDDPAFVRPDQGTTPPAPSLD
jgi:hypothetical protein